MDAKLKIKYMEAFLLLKAHKGMEYSLSDLTDLMVECNPHKKYLLRELEEIYEVEVSNRNPIGVLINLLYSNL